MFAFFCTTCETKLVAKDDKLLGKIVPCPKCGSMVLVQRSDDAPTPHVPQKSALHKRFPDVLTHGTASGFIGHTPGENLHAEDFLMVVPHETNVSETEVNARKILVGVLLGLSIFLLVALGFLMVYQGSEGPQPSPPQPPEPPPFILVPIDPPVEPAPLEPIEDIDIVPPPVEEPPQDPPAEPEPIHREQNSMTNDPLSAFEERMPGLVDISLPNIDIDAKLAMPIGEFNFVPSRLIEFVRVISQMTEIPMTLDIDEMKPHSLSVNTPVSGQFHEATAGKILTQTLATVGLQWIAVDRQILITPKETADATDLTFDVSDLVTLIDDLTPEVLADMILRLVAPEATVTVLPENRLTVVQDDNSRKSPARQRDDVLRLLEQLRAVRQLPPTTEWIGETLAPEAFGWDEVMKQMTLNHYRPVPLARLVAQLEAMTGLTMIVDHQSLHRALCSFASVQAMVQCDQGTVNDVLELSLASVDLAALTYRIVDHHTLEITMMESARQPEKMGMEVHRYELHADETPEDIVRSLRSTVFPDSWSEGDIVIDLPSSCLFVRQSQPAQRQIRLFLSINP